MAQWIAILGYHCAKILSGVRRMTRNCATCHNGNYKVALVCLIGLSDSRSWVGYEDDDYFESSLADPSDNNPNYRKQYWDSEEDEEESGYEHGFGSDKSSHQSYHYDRVDGYFGNDNDHDGFGHQHYDKYNHQGEHYDNNNGHYDHKPDFIPNWSSHQNGRDQIFHHHGNDERHNSQTGSGPPQGRPQPSQPGFPVRSGQNSESPSWGSHNNQNVRGSSNGGDSIVFPDFNNQIPTTRAPSTPRPASSTTGSTTTTNRLLDLVICVRSCPTTSEYNPVCGTNNVTFNNPGLLECAKNCGVDVSIARRAPCPRLPSTTTIPVTNRPTTTQRPATSTTTSTTTSRTTTPTRLTNINNVLVNQANTTLVPIEVLVSIFGKPSASEDPESDNFDIDRRRKLSASKL